MDFDDIAPAVKVDETSKRLEGLDDLEDLDKVKAKDEEEKFSDDYDIV